ncbi:MAG: aldo/keto reductase [bacterium]|nr:aldo/keto reductase [bacterium]
MKQLGFGTMRLPITQGQVDQKETEKLFDRFLAAGFTYFDTAYGYHDYKSEIFVREALVKRHPRESFLLADKMPVWLAKEEADLARLFNEQLEKTGAGYFDYYLLHALGGKNLEAANAVDAWSFVQKKKEEGLVKRIGFSFHDTPEVLETILSAHPEMEFVQLQINYADWENERVQSRRCYETARRHGKDVIIMEPVRGGSLAQLQPPLAAPFQAYAPEATLASWALRFCASLEGVIMVLSGMSAADQVEDNLKTFSPLQPLSAEERAVVEEVREAFAKVPSIPCTRCNYCTETCPAEIPIPGILRALNDSRIYGDAYAKKQYANACKDKALASECLNCESCIYRCPQHIPITEHLREAAEKFE